MDGKYPIDRGMRILGGFVLIILGLNVMELSAISRVTAMMVGFYGFITGIINFCPLLMGVAKEKEAKRKKTFKNDPVKPMDLKGLRFFSDLKDVEIERIVHGCKFMEYPPSTSVLKEGKEDKRCLYIIFSGQFKIVKALSEMGNKIISTISDGDVFGEPSFLDDYPASFSVVSMDQVKVLELEEKAFRELMQQNPRLANKIYDKLIHVMSARIRDLNEQVNYLGNWVLQGRVQSPTL
jgi:CRP-like cAMP-binding protein